MAMIRKLLLSGVCFLLMGICLLGCSSPLRAIAGSNIGPLHSDAWAQYHESRPFSFTLDVSSDPWSSSVTYGPVTVGSSIGLSGTQTKLAGLLFALEPTPLVEADDS